MTDNEAADKRAAILARLKSDEDRRLAEVLAEVFAAALASHEPVEILHVEAEANAPGADYVAEDDGRGLRTSWWKRTTVGALARWALDRLTEAEDMPGLELSEIGARDVRWRSRDGFGAVETVSIVDLLWRLSRWRPREASP